MCHSSISAPTCFTLGRGVALSADGSMLAASAAFQTVDGIETAGAVYLFQRIRNVWSLVSTFHAPEPNGSRTTSALHRT